jgi:ppGpp synthetase/RelA/SpoT-type nucleotidyltranferase
MADSKSPGAHKASLETILAEFDRREPTLTSFCSRTKSLIEAILQDANLRYQSVQARVKRKAKLEKKYLDPNKNYQQLDDITDLAGLRVITYYEDEVDAVAEVLEREFNIDRKDSVDKRNTEPDRFGYRAVNYVCGHLDKRILDVEYKQFAGVRCEIQITSILGHAWSEIEHEWYDLRDAYPDEVKRRFSIIAALFELAGREFVDIRKSKAKYERAVALQVEAGVPDIPMDAVSLKTFIYQEPLVPAIDNAVALSLGISILTVLTDNTAEMRSKAANFAGLTKLQDLRDALERLRAQVLEFVQRCHVDVWPNTRRSSQAERGVCIYHLALLIVAARGENDALELLRFLGISPMGVHLNRLTAIAKDILMRAGRT